MEPPRSQFSRRADNEAAALRARLLDLAAVAAEPGKHLPPMAAGLTRLGKTEAIRPESRFHDKTVDATVAWLEDCLRLRMRLRQYTATAILIPCVADSNCHADARLETRHTADGQIRLRRAALVKCKRPGQLACSELSA